MNALDKYQQDAERTSGMAGRHDEERLIHGAMSLGGEVGELQNYIKKGIWHGHGVDVEFVKEELSDCLWYIADLCSCMHLSMSEVANFNIEKLKARYPDGFDEERSKNRE